MGQGSLCSTAGLPLGITPPVLLPGSCPKLALPLWPPPRPCFLFMMDPLLFGLQKNGVDGQGMLGKDLLSGQPSSLAMAENPLYSSTCKGDKAEFPVAVRATLASERLRLWGRFLLVAGVDALELRDEKERTLLYPWPYKFLRRFGHDKALFSFEAGRRCVSGEGSFEFATKQGDEITRVIEEAIRVQRASGLKDPDLSSRAATLPAGAITGQASSDHPVRAGKGPAPGQEPSLQTVLTQALSLEPAWKTMPDRASLVVKGPGANSSKPAHPPHGPQPELRATEGSRKTLAPLAKVPAEGAYSEPFDALSGSSREAEGGSSYPLPPKGREAPSPATSWRRTPRSGPAPASPRPDHIYDEPGALAPVIYDEPQEYRGEAWKLQATAEDPVGYEYPYNPTLDDYSVPRMVTPPGAARARQEWPWRRNRL
ncbi:hypothetical protein JRQ81_011257 [Phrynocephalus forsythii]|uniref:IRS-type PTB domain-containing protein n=1 Tax=Phrynocephalus forsythii TaxID=171643 RepID=A0A9Q0X7U1_9SAUR|nr:hypothetical protein JRQ81_011257 [Phrynocephalus forsythii]